MGNIRIITDSASDMPVDYREDVTVVPLHVRFGTEEYLAYNEPGGTICF